MSSSMVSHSQYLCPDYLPASAPVEPKNHLALLAQTCNSIGHPDTPGKGKSTILPASEKASLSPSVKKETTASGKASPKKDPAEPPIKSERANSAGDPVTDENGNKSAESGLTESGRDGKNSRPTSAPESRNTVVAPSSSASQAVPAAVPSMPSTSSASRCFPSLPGGFPMTPHFGMPSVSSAALLHGLSAFPGMASGFPSIPGIGSSPRICTDPTCKTCPPSLFGGARTCPMGPGCTQCSSHAPFDLSAMWAASSYNSLLHGLGASNAASSQAAALSSLFPGFNPASANLNPSVSVAPSMSTQLPGSLQSLTGASGTGQHVCGWLIPGDGGSLVPCMKRFAGVEELNQHVKSHTSSDAGKSLSNASTLLGLASPPAGAPAPGHMNGRISPKSAAYHLSQALSRYHPYAPKLSSPGSAAAALPATPALSNPHMMFSSSLPPSMGYSAALSSLYAGQRLPGSLPHP